MLTAPVSVSQCHAASWHGLDNDWICIFFFLFLSSLLPHFLHFSLSFTFEQVAQTRRYFHSEIYQHKTAIKMTVMLLDILWANQVPQCVLCSCSLISFVKGFPARIIICICIIYMSCPAGIPAVGHKYIFSIKSRICPAREKCICTRARYPAPRITSASMFPFQSAG